MKWIDYRELLFSDGNKFYYALCVVDKKAKEELDTYGFVFSGKTKVIKVLKTGKSLKGVVE